MDLEILEGLALSEDRSGALAQLLPGSAEHDYYRCLHAQHAGRLDEAEQILEEWSGRHGHDAAYERLRLRQLLLRVNDDPDAVRDQLGVSHWHEAEVVEVDPTRATRLPGFDPSELLRQAAAGADLSQVTDEGMYELLDWTMDAARRRTSFGRIGHTPHPKLVDYIVEDLAARGTFGTHTVHANLTLDQLHEIAQRRSELRTNTHWLAFVITRMNPPASVDLEIDRDAREAYVTALWAFVAELPPATNSLKAHVLWHLLDTRRRRGAAGRGRAVRAYLELPRQAGYCRAAWLERVRRDEIAQLGQDYASVTGLPAVGNDEELVRDLVHARVADAARFVAVARSRLARGRDRDGIVARRRRRRRRTRDARARTGARGGAARAGRARVVRAQPDPVRRGRADRARGRRQERRRARREGVPDRSARVLPAPPHASSKADLDLDGLAASHELAMRFTEPPMRRVRRRIELPMCARAGTYVVDLIGNGIASRVDDSQGPAAPRGADRRGRAT